MIVMRKKSIFKASFEESLNLEDDGFKKLQQEQHEKTVKFFAKGKPSIWFIIRSFIMAIIFPVGFNFIVLVFSLIFHDDSENLPVSIAEPPTLTVNVYLLLFIWIVLVLLGKIVNKNFLFPYRYQFHAYLFMNWFQLELNLLVIDFLIPNLSFLGVLSIYSFICVFICFLTSYEFRNINKLLFGVVSSPRLIDKVANKISVYGMGILGLAVIINFILKSFSVKLSTSMESFGLLLIWFIGNIFVITIDILIGFPYFLEGYYKWKYPEEYREWEGKSLEEWYGKRYLKKHPELLKKGLHNN